MKTFGRIKTEITTENPESRAIPPLKRSVGFIVFFYFLLVTPQLASSGDHPFIHSANWGGTGLMEIPNARVLEDGILQAGYAEARPYRWFGGAMGVFPGLEIGFVLTELTNIKALSDAYGNYKDKALFAKYQILPESKWFPALAVGVFDFHGTQLFQSEYLVLSRQIFPFDFTFGLGRKRLKSDVGLTVYEDAGIFGGFEWAIHYRLRLMAEYNPIQYEKDAPRAVPKGAKSPFNFGVRYELRPGFDLGISFQRGEKIGLMGHIQLDIGKERMPKKPDPCYWGSSQDPANASFSPLEYLHLVKEKIQKAGMVNVLVYRDGNTLAAEFENAKYLHNQKAVGRIFRILYFNSTEEIHTLKAVLTSRRIPILSITVSRENIRRFLFGKITKRRFLSMVRAELYSKTKNKKNRITTAEKKWKLNYGYGIKPDFDPFLNDPSGFFKLRTGIQPFGSASLWPGGSFYARFDIPLYTSITSSNKPIPGAVRSDYWTYVNEKTYYFEKLLFDQAFKISDRIFGRFSLGYQERMYAGANAEVLAFIGDGNLAVGLQGDWVKKREQKTWFGLKDFKRHTVLGNIYYTLDDYDLTIQAQYGKFLAGDVGWRFDVGRTYGNGLEIGFWYSFTDTDIFTDRFNKGYHEKGVYMSIPVRIFSRYETTRKLSYGISPWTRDVAVTIPHWQSLFGMGKSLMPRTFKADIERITE
ncbi:MAG: YjbH domain-containing protein [Desulfobacterales bacterium]